MDNFFSRNIWKIGLILLIVLIPIILAFALGKIKLSDMFNQPGTSTSKPAQPKQQITLYCPSVNDFCTTGGQIKKNNLYLGFGGKVFAGKPIKTAFNGKLSISYRNEASVSGIEKITVARLDNFEAKKTAFYLFIGSKLPEKDLPTSPNGYVKVGTTFGKITSDMKSYGTSLLFQLFDGDPSKTKPLPLQISSFTLN